MRLIPADASIPFIFHLFSISVYGGTFVVNIDRTKDFRPEPSVQHIHSFERKYDFHYPPLLHNHKSHPRKYGGPRSHDLLSNDRTTSLEITFNLIQEHLRVDLIQVGNTKLEYVSECQILRTGIVQLMFCKTYLFIIFHIHVDLIS